MKLKQISGLGTAAALDAGTLPTNLIQLGAGGALPAVDGSQLTGITSGGGGAETSVPLANVVNVPISGNYTISGSSASGSVYFVDTSSATQNLTIYLPSASTFGAGQYLTIARSGGSVSFTVQAASGDSARGLSSFNPTTGQSWTLMSDGSSKWITLEMGYV